MKFGNYFFLTTLSTLLHMTCILSTEPYCSLGSPQPDPSAQPLPTMPESFQTRLEANMVDRGFTMEATEYADSDGNRAALTVIQNGDLSMLIYDYAAGQVYNVHDGVCTTKTISNDTLDDYLFGDITVRGVGHIYSTNDIIKFAKRFGETYKGQSSVRGIWCDHWQSCMYWDYFKANFTLDYYFTALNWTTSMTFPQVPVRADVTGIMQTTSGSRSFHHIYDYYDFRPGIEPGTTAFETPPNVICPNRKTLKLIPKLADQFYFRSEQTNSNTGMTVNMQVWYDTEYKVIRADYGLHQPAIHIEDFNRGILYVIDKEYGTCTVGSIPVTTQAGEKVGNSNNWVLSLLSPRDFLRLQGNFVFVGQRTVRGLTCDLFVAAVTGEDTSQFTSSSSDNATVEAYFSRLNENETPDTGAPGDPDAYSHVLVQMIVYVNQSLFDNVISYYDFDFTHSNPETTFDLTPCYSDKQKIGFRIKIAVNATEFLPYKMTIKEKVYQKLSVGLQLEPTRIQHLNVYTDSKDDLYVSGQLLDRPPLLARYYKIPNQTIELVDRQYSKVTSGEDCADLCDADTECVSFALCFDSHICYLSHVVQQYDPNYDKPLTFPSCVRYSAVVKRPKGLPDHDLQTAWLNLKNMVFTGELTFEMQMPALSTWGIQISATEVIEDDTCVNHNTDFVHAIQRYRAGAQLISPSSTLTGLAFDECARQCVGDTKCEGFSYCNNNTVCQLSTEQITNAAIQEDPSQYTLCSVYDVTARSSSYIPNSPVPKTNPVITTQVPSPKPMTSKMPSSTPSAASTRRNPTFVLYKENAIFADVSKTKTAKSIDECLEYCIQDTLCLTITICERQQTCRLSNEQPDKSRENLVHAQSGCEIHTVSTDSASSTISLSTSTPKSISQSSSASNLTPKTPLPSNNTTSISTAMSSSFSSTPASTSYFTTSSATSRTTQGASSPTSPVSPGCPTATPDTGNAVSGYTLVAWTTMPGVAKVSKQLVDSSSKCGTYCDGRTDFNCKAFQYCPGNNMCNLMDTRHLPAPRTLRYETTCQFYTRQYLTDFVKQNSTPSGSDQFTPVEGVPLMTCADICGEDVTSCTAFQYCAATQDCLLETSQTAISYSSQSQSNCQYYKRNPSTVGAASDQQGATSTGMTAGIAIATLVLGVAVGAVATFLIQRHRRRKHDEFDMQNILHTT